VTNVALRCSWNFHCTIRVPVCLLGRCFSLREKDRMRGNINYFSLASRHNSYTPLVPLPLEESEEGILINTANFEAAH
jgi:hypothetical protein